jgi:hypothetical protein
MGTRKTAAIAAKFQQCLGLMKNLSNLLGMQTDLAYALAYAGGEGSL